MRDDLRLELRSRNNALWHAIFDHFDSTAAFCRHWKLSQSVVGGWLDLKRSPYSTWNRSTQAYDAVPFLVPGAQRLAALLQLAPYELFPPDIYGGEFATVRVAEVPSAKVLALLGADQHQRLLAAAPASGEEAALVGEQRRLLSEAMQTLTKREQDVIRQWFGLNQSGEQTLREQARDAGVGQGEMHGVAGRAFRKLRKHMRQRNIRSSDILNR